MRFHEEPISEDGCFCTIWNRKTGEDEPAWHVAGNGCWPWDHARSEDGYGQVRRDGVLFRATRVIWEMTRGKIPDGYQLHHLCGHPPCVNPDHLQPVTPEEHWVLTVGQLKLSDVDVHAIRLLWESTTLMQMEIAKMFKISKQYVNKILNGTRKRNVEFLNPDEFLAGVFRGDFGLALPSPN